MRIKKNEIMKILCCPYCGNKIEISGDILKCTSVDCNKMFPKNNGIPIIINEEESIFNNDMFLQECETFFHKNSPLVQNIKKTFPNISANFYAKDNYNKLFKLININSSPKVLIIGGSILGAGLKNYYYDNNITFVSGDVSLGQFADIIFDAHNIPFADKYFDAVIVQAVLEHVVDPFKCVSEIHRVLKENGVVYSETPFMQQVHGGKYDFHRFTFLGHRRLFREFSQIDAGVLCGPGMALAWSLKYYFLSFINNKYINMVIGAFCNLLFCVLKYSDINMKNRRGAYDGASAFYFLGRKSEEIISDMEILNLYYGRKMQ